jgi:hypothetical protein
MHGTNSVLPMLKEYDVILAVWNYLDEQEQP